MSAIHSSGTFGRMDYEAVKVPVEALITYVSLFAGQRGCSLLLAWLKTELTADLEARIAALEARK